MTAVDRLAAKLANEKAHARLEVLLGRVVVPPHVRRKDGKTEAVEGYVYERRDVRRAVEVATRARLDQARQREPKITKRLKSLAAGVPGAKMEGLDFRIKGEKSAVRKVQAELPEHAGNPNLTAAAMSDFLRYTMSIPDDGYAAGAWSVLRKLHKEGWTIRSKNKWQPGDEYQGLNVALTAPDGFPVELQFHTPASLEAKERAHVLYEKYRVEEDSEERRRLYEKMLAIAASIPIPKGIEGLPSSTWKPYEDLPALPKF